MNNNGQGGQITITLVPTATDGQYQLQIHYEHVPGWPAVYEALLGSLEAVLMQITGTPDTGRSQLYQSMLAVLRNFGQAALKAQVERPAIQRVTQLPPEWRN